MTGFSHRRANETLMRKVYMAKVPTFVTGGGGGDARRAGQVAAAAMPLHKRHGGKWEFPGGKVESEEIPEACIVVARSLRSSGWNSHRTRRARRIRRRASFRRSFGPCPVALHLRSLARRADRARGAEHGAGSRCGGGGARSAADGSHPARKAFRLQPLRATPILPAYVGAAPSARSSAG